MHIDFNLTLVLVGIIGGLLFEICREEWQKVRARRSVVKPPVAAETPPAEKS